MPAGSEFTQIKGMTDADTGFNGTERTASDIPSVDPDFEFDEAAAHQPVAVVSVLAEPLTAGFLISVGFTRDSNRDPPRFGKIKCLTDKTVNPQTARCRRPPLPRDRV